MSGYGSRRRLNRMFSRERLADYLRTLLWVAPLTLLIWLYAEREQIATVSDVPVRFDVEANGLRQVATVVRPADRTVVVTLEGPRVRLDSLRTRLAGDGPQSVITIDLPPDVPLGTASRSVVEELNRQSLFRFNGVKVVSAAPAQFVVEVDELATKELVVVADPSATGLEGLPVFEPPTVKLTGPKSVLDRITEEDAAGRPAVRAALQALPSLRSPGEHVNVEVSLVMPSAVSDSVDPSRFTLQPERVRATFRVRQADVTLTLPSVPIFPLAPQTLLDTYRPVFEPTLPNVTVIGPRDVIESLRNGTAGRMPRAILELSRDDLPPGRPRTRQVRFDLPEGLRVSPEDARREVEFTLVPRTRPE
ncbi:MAG: hypothetical protein ACK4PI_03930 [Tepidisphaerales bacterium]